MKHCVDLLYKFVLLLSISLVPRVALPRIQRLQVKPSLFLLQRYRLRISAACLRPHHLQHLRVRATLQRARPPPLSQLRVLRARRPGSRCEQLLALLAAPPLRRPYLFRRNRQLRLASELPKSAPHRSVFNEPPGRPALELALLAHTRNRRHSLLYDVLGSCS